MSISKNKFQIYNNESLKTFFKYSMRYKWSMILVVIMSGLTSSMAAVPAYLIKYFVEDVIVNNDIRMMVFVVTGVFISIIIKVLSGYFATTSSAKITESIRRDIRLEVYSHLQKLSIGYFKKNKLGDLMARLSGDSAALGQIGFYIFDMFKEFLLILALLVKLIHVDIILTIISLIVMPLLIGTVRKYTKKIRNSGRIRQDMTGEVTAFIQETLSGIFVIKSFSSEDKMLKKYEKISMEEFEKSYRSRKIKAKVNPINEVLTTLMILLVVSYGGYQVMITKTFSSGDLISFVTALGLMHQPLKRFISKNNDLQEALPSADRVIEILKEPIEIQTMKNPTPCSNKIETIEFKNVSFGYENEEEMVLKDINLNVKAGEVVALIGKSGSGKTTFANLIPRFYDVESGSILVNEVNIKDYDVKEYRENIGIVPQESFLFSGTISENIAFGQNTVDMVDVEKAAKVANAYDFIMDLPKKFDTEVGERGVLLSGGQKQRISIARAIMRNPQIMILDEATSALDSESEKLVQDALDKIMSNRTTFVIAHRLSTIINSDIIVVLDEGKIKEMGKHKELLEKGGLYSYYYDIQFKDKEEVKAL